MRDLESGIYLVFTAIALFALFALIALAIGLGLVVTDSTKMQHIGNVSALAAIKEYVDQRGLDPTQTPEQLSQRARDRATAILAANRIRSAEAPLNLLKLPYETVGPDSSGILQPGAWYPGDPDGTGPNDPCNSDPNAEPTEPPSSYPCFIPVDPRNVPLSWPINSMRVSIRNQESNPIVAPFAEMIGDGSNGIRAGVNATASLMQRCTALVLDVSRSQVLETHFEPFPNVSGPDQGPPGSPSYGENSRLHSETTPLPNGNECYDPPYSTANPPYRVVCPKHSSLYAYRVSQVTPGGNPTGWGPLSTLYNPPFGNSGCKENLNSNPIANPEGVLWCNVATRNGRLRERPSVPDPNDPHYRQHFLDVPGPPEFGLLRVDHFTNPEPFSSFLLGFNAALRLIRQQSTSGDQAVLIPMTGRIRNRVPPSNTTPEIDLLIQLTNINNRQQITGFTSDPIPVPILSTTPVVHPNFIDAGILPLFSNNPLDNATDITLALRDAISAIQSNCPPLSQKSVIIATDGIMTCADNSLVSPAIPNCPPSRDYATFTRARRQLLGPQSAEDPLEPILEILKEQEIILSVLLRGAVVQPHFKRKIDSNNNEILTPNEAYALGFGPEDLFDQGYSGASTAQEAYINAGKPNVIFREPNYILGRLALESGGIFCPLLNPCSNPAADCPACTAAEPPNPINECYKQNPDDPSGPRILRDCAKHPIDNIALRPLRTCAPQELSPGEQAGYCSARTVGGNPYIIVD